MTQYPEFPRVLIRYSNGVGTMLPPERWSEARGDGVTEVYLEPRRGEGTRLTEAGFYWLYRATGAWVLGASNGDAQGHETVHADDGTVVDRDAELELDRLRPYLKLGA